MISATLIGVTAALVVIAAQVTEARLVSRAAPPKALVPAAAVLSVIFTIRLFLRAKELGDARSLDAAHLISQFDNASLLALVVINILWVWLANRLRPVLRRSNPHAVAALSTVSVAVLLFVHLSMVVSQGKLSI